MSSARLMKLLPLLIAGLCGSCASEVVERDPLDPSGAYCYCTYGTHPMAMNTEKMTKRDCNRVLQGTCSFR
jgi:hypothetical protein